VKESINQIKIKAQKKILKALGTSMQKGVFQFRTGSDFKWIAGSGSNIWEKSNKKKFHFFKELDVIHKRLKVSPGARNPQQVLLTS
jgi:hypothetical protein